MSEEEMSKFCRIAFKHGWISFFTLGRPCNRSSPGSRVGGTLTLVSKRVKSATAFHLNHEGGQVMAVQVGSLTLYNLYGHLNRSRPAFYNLLFEQLQAHCRLPFLILGDWNEQPADSPISQALSSQGFEVCSPEDGMGSRWGSQRIIDFVMGRPGLVRDLKALDAKMSDHRAFSFQISVPDAQTTPSYEIRPCNVYLPKDPDMFPNWTEELSIAWKVKLPTWNRVIEQLRNIASDTNQSEQARADTMWKKMNEHLESFLLTTARNTSIDMQVIKKPTRIKGSEVQSRQINRATSQPYDGGACNILRVLRRLWGRLKQFEHRQHHNQIIDKKLKDKIFHSPHWTPGTRAQDIEQQINKLENQQRTDRLRNWRNRLRLSEKETYRWMRSNPLPASHNVFEDDQSENDPASVSSTETREKIHNYWTRIWHRTDDDSALSASDYLVQNQVPARPQQHWHPVPFDMFLKAARKQKSKAGGADGWHGTEMALFPEAMWESLSEFYHLLENLGAFPQIWSQIRQTHIPKPGKQREVDKASPVSKLRPISVMSIWWQIFITARLQTEEAQTWYNQQLAPQQFGCRRKRNALSAVVALTEAQTKGHFLATLDLSQAFDRIRPQRALDTLKHYGFPQKLAAAVAGLWFNQQRILMWNQCCRQSITVVNASIPQGDSLSPWAMNLMLTGPTACVAQQYPNSTQIVYVDDRSFAAPTVQMLRNVWTSWQEHTAALGFKENISKTQAFARSAKGRRALLAHPDFAPYVTDDFTVLGVSFRPGNTRPSDKEKSKFQKAEAAAKRARVAPVVAFKRQFMATTAAASKAIYGWVLRAAPQYWVTGPLKSCFGGLFGHGLDTQFMCGQAAVMAIVRFTRNTQRILTDWTRKGGMSCRIRRFMKSLGFVELSAFQQHPQLFQNFALSVESVNARTSDELCHDLREAWRWSVWDHLTQRSTRRDVALIRHLQFPSQRLKVVQKECSKPVTAHLPAIVTGAFVSPLRYFRMTGHGGEQCPFCESAVGSAYHCFWDCSVLNPDRKQPADVLEATFGWPLGQNTEALRHMAEVRRKVLEHRYGARDT